jgi:hypothetical protein
MKTKDIFNLAVRLLGLVFLYHGLQAFPAAAALFMRAFPHELGPHVSEPMNMGRFFAAFFMIGWPLFLAQWLVRGAPLLMRIAYPDAVTREREMGTAMGEKADA